jgi:hypothetical protein
MIFNSAGPDRPPVSASGFAPWPPRSPTVTVTALFVLFVAFVAAFAFAWVLIATIDTNVELSFPSAASRLSPAYRHQPNWRMQPEVMCSVTSGVCVMRMSAFASPAASRRQTIEEIRQQIAAVPSSVNVPCIRQIEADDPIHDTNVKRALLAGADLSEPQMFAMMNMSESHRHQAIWHHARLNIFELPPFTLSTFRELADKGYAHKPEDSRYHKLTLAASSLADATADELVARHKIHAPILVHTRGLRAKQINFRCTCKWSCGLTAGDNMQAKANRAFTSHLRSVNTLNDIADSISRTTRRQGET